MAKIIFISPYLKGGQNQGRLRHRTNYIATREGVELLKSEHGSEPATKKQREYIYRLVKSFPQSVELAEYEDYRSDPTRGNAAEFIDQVWEQFITAMDQRENFLDYVSHRPGVRSDGDHGLWDRDGKVPNLKRAVEEVANHPGIVWTPVVSLRREDAERLGYTDVDNWRALVNSCAQEIADGYKIPLEHLRWYAALHEKEKHIHIHMMVFSSDPKEGYLTKQGIRDIKSAFASRVFEQDLLQVYERKTEYRSQLQRSAQERMEELVSNLKQGTLQNEKLEHLIEELSRRLRTTKGKKVYGYLPPQTKRIVDEIVDELARDPRVAAAYSLWQDMQDEVVRTYTDDLPERKPLSRQKEFKPVRNMVIREALKLSETDNIFADESDEVMDDEPEPTPLLRSTDDHLVYEQADRYRQAKKVLYDDYATPTARWSAAETMEQLWVEGYSVAAHLLGKVYRDGVGVNADRERAGAWFRRAAERGLTCSASALGRLLLTNGQYAEALHWLHRAADANDQYAEYTLGKVYLKGELVPKNVTMALCCLYSSAQQGNQYAQYALGKLYLKGQDVPPNRELAIRYLTLSADQGNSAARSTLDHLNDPAYSPNPALALIRMLHHMANIFRDTTAQDSTHMGLHIDRKRRRELQEKRIAMGHKPDDHEEQVMG